MGASCCIAARNASLSSVTEAEMSEHNDVHSPSWNFQWQNRLNFDNGNYRNNTFSFRNPRNIPEGRENRSGSGSLTPDFDGSSAETFQQFGGCGADSAGISGRLDGSSSSLEVASDVSPSLDPGSLDHGLILSTCSPSKIQLGASHLSCYASELSRTVQLSRCKLSKRATEWQFPTLRSESDATEGRQSLVPSLCSEDQAGSGGVSSDGWSLRTFCELIASQREKQSFGSGNASPVHGVIRRSNSHSFTSSSSREFQSCGICSKLLVDLSVVAVLVCGHVYHGECLEHVTPEASKFDPCCPVCVGGEKSISKVSRVPKFDIRSRTKISRIDVVDSDVDALDSLMGGKRECKSAFKMNTASSMRRSLTRPFMKRHFSTGAAKADRHMMELATNGARKRGFLIKHRRE